MNQDYVSTALYCGRAIDCRCLTAAFEFYQLSKNQMTSLVTETLLWLLKIVPKDKFISKGTRPRAIEKALHVFQSLDKGHYHYGLEAYAVSPRVYNIKTLNEHHRNCLRGVYEDVTDPFRDIAKDNLQFWDALFPQGRESNDRVITKILRIFNEKGRFPVHNFYLPDVQAGIDVSSYEKSDNQYYGNFYIDFSAFCLGDNLKNMANTFADFVQHLSKTYINLNARVMLQPVIHTDGHSPYSLYFGHDGLVDDSHLETNFTETEWYKTYYLPGAEWLNIVSPLARSHIPALCSQDGVQTGVLVEPLPGGALLVQAKASVDEYDIADAKIIKGLLYPALYPGRSFFSISLFFTKHDSGRPAVRLPRDNWAIVPVFEDEINVVSTYLVFKYLKDRGRFA